MALVTRRGPVYGTLCIQHFEVTHLGVVIVYHNKLFYIGSNDDSMGLAYCSLSHIHLLMSR